LVQFQSSG